MKLKKTPKQIFTLRKSFQTRVDNLKRQVREDTSNDDLYSIIMKVQRLEIQIQTLDLIID